MNQKDAEKWICENTKLAYWSAFENRARPLRNAFYSKLKSLTDESTKNTTILHSVDSTNRA